VHGFIEDEFNEVKKFDNRKDQPKGAVRLGVFGFIPEALRTRAPGFRAYLARFPKSEYAGNAQYWIGEIAYVQGDYPMALREFEKVVRDYDNGNKAAAAMLKMGFCRAQMNDLAGAKAIFRSVVQKYPNSDEAQIAKQRLK
jgi:tol-pal system protein YbgF